jgi:hypothetical protein
LQWVWPVEAFGVFLGAEFWFLVCCHWNAEERVDGYEKKSQGCHPAIGEGKCIDINIDIEIDMMNDVGFNLVLVFRSLQGVLCKVVLFFRTWEYVYAAIVKGSALRLPCSNQRLEFGLLVRPVEGLVELGVPGASRFDT